MFRGLDEIYHLFLLVGIVEEGIPSKFLGGVLMLLDGGASKHKNDKLTGRDAHSAIPKVQTIEPGHP